MDGFNNGIQCFKMTIVHFYRTAEINNCMVYIKELMMTNNFCC